MAVCHAGRGALDLERKQYDRAGASYRAAAEILDALRRARPSETYRDRLALVNRGLARVAEGTGDLSGARASHGRALALWEGLAGDHPAVVDYVYNRALSHHFLAELDNPYEHPPGDAGRAESHYKEAEAALRGLADRRRVSPPIRNAWARTCLGLGRCYQAGGRPDEARPVFQKAFEIWEGLKGDACSDYRRRYRGELRSRLDASPPSRPGGDEESR